MRIAPEAAPDWEITLTLDAIFPETKTNWHQISRSSRNLIKIVLPCWTKDLNVLTSWL